MSVSNMLPTLSDGFAWPTLAIDRSRLLTGYQACVKRGVRYRLGAKPLAGDGTFLRSDCSGFVGWLLYFATGGTVDLCGLGTYHQSEWFRQAALKVSTVEAGRLDDGAVRVAVMLASPSRGRFVGHIAIIYQGVTLECYGGVGVGSRAWTGQGWQRHATVYVLSPPTDDEL